MHPDAFASGLVQLLREEDRINVYIESLNSGDFEKRYRYVRVLGSGMTSAVKLVEEKKTHDYFAVKYFDLASQSPELVATIRREMKCLEQLQHPNILNLQRAFVDSSFFYLLTDWCDGGDLRHFIHECEHQRLTESQFIPIFYDVVCALYHMHSKGIWHCDLKLANVFLSTRLSGSPPRAILGDLGLATVGRDDLHSEIGTLAYASPEMVRNGKVGPELDVWSLGVLAYFALTGTPPFVDSAPKKQRESILNSEILIPDYISRRMRRLILGCLRRNPADRITLDKILHSKLIRKRMMKCLNTHKLQSKIDANFHVASRTKSSATNPDDLSEEFSDLSISLQYRNSRLEPHLFILTPENHVMEIAATVPLVTWDAVLLITNLEAPNLSLRRLDGSRFSQDSKWVRVQTSDYLCQADFEFLTVMNDEKIASMLEMIWDDPDVTVIVSKSGSVLVQNFASMFMFGEWYPLGCRNVAATLADPIREMMRLHALGNRSGKATAYHNGISGGRTQLLVRWWIPNILNDSETFLFRISRLSSTSPPGGSKSPKPLVSVYGLDSSRMYRSSSDEDYVSRTLALSPPASSGGVGSGALGPLAMPTHVGTNGSPQVLRTSKRRMSYSMCKSGIERESSALLDSSSSVECNRLDLKGTLDTSPDNVRQDCSKKYATTSRSDSRSYLKSQFHIDGNGCLLETCSSPHYLVGDNLISELCSHQQAKFSDWVLHPKVSDTLTLFGALLYSRNNFSLYKLRIRVESVDNYQLEPAADEQQALKLAVSATPYLQHFPEPGRCISMNERESLDSAIKKYLSGVCASNENMIMLALNRNLNIISMDGPAEFFGQSLDYLKANAAEIIIPQIMSGLNMSALQKLCEVGESGRYLRQPFRSKLKFAQITVSVRVFVNLFRLHGETTFFIDISAVRQLSSSSLSSNNK